jgi:mono/diheme cytochrome c family protein
MRRALLAVLLIGCATRFARDTTAQPFSSTPAEVARGRYLVDAVTACGACHTGRQSGVLTDPEDPRLYLAGGNTLEDVGNFKLYVPNITSDAETGLGKWSDDRIARAIRDGIDNHDSMMFPVMPFPSYQHMSDADVRAIVAYLRTVPSVRQQRPPFDREIPFMAKMGMDLGFLHHEPAKTGAQAGPRARAYALIETAFWPWDAPRRVLTPAHGRGAAAARPPRPRAAA